MDEEIQLINDGDGLAVIGDPSAVDRFLSSEGLESKDLGLRRLGPKLGKAAGIMDVGSQVAANSGRWVKLTDESARAIKKYGLMKNSKSGLSMGVVQAKGQSGGIKAIVQFTSGPASKLANPALLAGAAGIMAQAAMQQTMDEITDYLAAIDEKVDDILRAQKDAVLADMLGVDFVIEEAFTIREEVGRVSEVTWSKVQATSGTIGRTRPTRCGSWKFWQKSWKAKQQLETLRRPQGKLRRRCVNGSRCLPAVSSSKMPSTYLSLTVFSKRRRRTWTSTVSV